MFRNDISHPQKSQRVYLQLFVRIQSGLGLDAGGLVGCGLLCADGFGVDFGIAGVGKDSGSATIGDW